MSNVRLGQKGYHGTSMSNRALTAYENGEKPLSKITKIDAAELNTVIVDHLPELPTVTVTTLKKLLRIWGCSSAHHTSKRANLTDFYHLATLFDAAADPDWTEDLTADQVDIFRLRYTDYLERTAVYEHLLSR